MKNFPFEEPDAIRRMREMAERFTKPSREYERMMRGLREPDAVRQMREMAESFAKSGDNYERMMRSLGASNEHTRRMFEEPASLRELRRHMQIGDELRRFMAPYREQQSSIDQMLTAFRPKTGAFEELLHAAFQPSAMLAFLAEADNVLKAFRISDIGPDGATVDGEEISFDNAEQELERVWGATAGLPAADRITATTRSASQSPAVLLLVMLLGYVLGAMFESPIQTISDPVLLPRAKQIRKWLETNAPSVWATQLAPDVRTVTKDSLELRALPRRSSTKRGVLYADDRVEVLEKRKDWSLIVSLDDENLGGWAFTRYLARTTPQMPPE
jgi:hypothetical protein